MSAYEPTEPAEVTGYRPVTGAPHEHQCSPGASTARWLATSPGATIGATRWKPIVGDRFVLLDRWFFSSKVFKDAGRLKGASIRSDVD